ncbi:FAD-dependent oxidoreductase [Piscinibacter sp. HJYY11]|uniref:FAD-dependent oxidoreductase n=1 Tax=Piscinibacter sp. HJYY11 TaxID=2801333 RepID=UPI00191CB8BB|nr:FAD-dependent oxidoreductase [Piscinibacter sp. HJYY11]MBL0726764.1 FAD-dependent oxidoreductase [Piscinibacter sp. HJYY11]
MRVAVIGAGIVGVTSAYELAADGHEVTVFERRGSVAAESSFANAGVIAPGYVTPWASPGMPWHVMSHLFQRHAPVRLNARMGASSLGWMWRWWRACRPAAYRSNRARLQRLATYSKQRLHKLTHALQLDYERTEGYLVLLRNGRDEERAQAGLALLNEAGMRYQLLDASQCRQVEPGLSSETPLHAGIHLPQDEVGNCRQFALLLRTEAERLGAKFCFHTNVQHLQPGVKPSVTKVYSPMEESTWVSADAARLDGTPTDVLPFEPETETFDAVLVCAAVDSTQLLRAHGLKLPLVPVYGYSVTAPLRKLDVHPDIGPRSAVMDERYKVAVSRFGSRLRVAGSAEIGGQPERHHKAALATLYKVLNDWFPGAAHMSQAQVWKGARPMLPDGPPLLGASGLPGVWLNLGHGSSGWALACGSARVVADAISSRPPAIDTEGLGLERLRH